MGSKDSIVVGLDIGTNKVACVVGERNGLGGVDIIGIGTAPSTGLRKGVVINIEDTNRSIRAAIDEAEMMSGVEIATVYAGIAGGAHPLPEQPGHGWREDGSRIRR